MSLKAGSSRPSSYMPTHVWLILVWEHLYLLVCCILQHFTTSGCRAKPASSIAQAGQLQCMLYSNLSVEALISP